MSKKLTFSQIKGLQILETVQYTSLLVFTIIVLSYIMGRLYLLFYALFKNYLPNENDHELSNIVIIVQLILGLCILTIIFHYIIKYIKTIPSLSSYLVPLYTPHKFLETIIHFAGFHFLLDLHPEVKDKIHAIYKMIHGN